MSFVSRSLHAPLKGEVRRKMNFTYVLGFVVLRDVVKFFPIISSSNSFPFLSDKCELTAGSDEKNTGTNFDLNISSSFARKTVGRNRA